MVAAGALSIGMRTPRTRADDVRAVYEAVLRSECIAPDSPRVVVYDATWFDVDDDVQPFEDLSPSTFDDYRAQPEGALPRQLALHIPIERITAAEFSALVDDYGGLDGAWRRFYELHPGALGSVEFSPVGFNRDRSEALVHIGQQRGPLFGRGRFVRLTRTSSGWQVVDRVGTWIS